MINQFFKLLGYTVFITLFLYFFVEAFNEWDTAPPPSLNECVDGTVRVEYGNCVLPEEIDHGP